MKVIPEGEGRGAAGCPPPLDLLRAGALFRRVLESDDSPRDHVPGRPGRHGQLLLFKGDNLFPARLVDLLHWCAPCWLFEGTQSNASEAQGIPPVWTLP